MFGVVAVVGVGGGGREEVLGGCVVEVGWRFDEDDPGGGPFLEIGGGGGGSGDRFSASHWRNRETASQSR